MDETTSREKILKRIRNALIDKPSTVNEKIDWERRVFAEMPDPLDVNFARELTKVSGKFLYCENEDEFKKLAELLMQEKEWKQIFCLDPEIQKLLNEAGISFTSDENQFLSLNVGITRCEFLVARLGSVMVSSAQASGRRLNVFPEVHLVMAYSSQIVPDLKDALKGIKEKYQESFPTVVSVITGPSRTADIEKTLVMGAHGPKELYVFVIEDRF